MLSVLTAPLDPAAVFRLGVEVSDRGEPPLTSSSVLTLHTAERTTFPVFSAPETELTVPENVLEAVLPRVEANGLGASEVVYAIEAGNREDRFRIDPASGQLSLSKPLDFEQVTVLRQIPSVNNKYFKYIGLQI